MRTQVPATGAPLPHSNYTHTVRKYFEFQLASTRVVASFQDFSPTPRVVIEFQLLFLLQKEEIRDEHHREVTRVLSNPEPALEAEVKEVEGTYPLSLVTHVFF